MKFHEKIRWAIKKRGWSMRYMRKRAGLSFKRLCEIQDGKSVKLSELVKIADALNRDIDFFVKDDDPNDDPIFFLKDDDPDDDPIFLWCNKDA